MNRAALKTFLVSFIIVFIIVEIAMLAMEHHEETHALIERTAPHN